MTPGLRSFTATRSRPLVRLTALVTLTAFLVGQSWMMCAPLCLLEGHAQMAMSSHYQNHTPPCHSGKLVQRQLPVPQPLGQMLVARVTPLLPSLRVFQVYFTPPPRVQLQQIPLLDPPPPRPV